MELVVAEEVLVVVEGVPAVRVMVSVKVGVRVRA